MMTLVQHIAHRGDLPIDQRLERRQQFSKAPLAFLQLQRHDNRLDSRQGTCQRRLAQAITRGQTVMS